MSVKCLFYPKSGHFPSARDGRRVFGEDWSSLADKKPCRRDRKRCCLMAGEGEWLCTHVTVVYYANPVASISDQVGTAPTIRMSQPTLDVSHHCFRNFIPHPIDAVSSGTRRFHFEVGEGCSAFPSLLCTMNYGENFKLSLKQWTVLGGNGCFPCLGHLQMDIPWISLDTVSLGDSSLLTLYWTLMLYICISIYRNVAILSIS